MVSEIQHIFIIIINTNTEVKLIWYIKAAYLDPADADTTLKQLLDGTGEEECDGESHSGVERHCHKHTARCDGISQKDVESEGDEDDDLAGAEEGGHV